MRHGHNHADGDHRRGRGDGGRGRGGRHGGRRGGRLFDYGELRLLVLAMIAGEPSHGYEIIKQIEERFAGSYSPSPGVIYPTLSWLEDMGYASVEIVENNRKRYHPTDDGAAFLEANRDAADALLTRSAPQVRGEAPPPVIRAMENLKTALRLRLEREPLEPAAIETIAAAIDEAAKAVERS